MTTVQGRYYLRLPSGPLDGAIPLGNALRTLHDHGVLVQKRRDGATRIERGEILETCYFTDPVPRWIIQRLIRLFDIDWIEFYSKPGQPGFEFKEPDDDEN